MGEDDGEEKLAELLKAQFEALPLTGRVAVDGQPVRTHANHGSVVWLDDKSVPAIERMMDCKEYARRYQLRHGRRDYRGYV